MEVALLERATLLPPAGAVWEIVIVQVVEEDAVMLVLAHCSELTLGRPAATVMVNVLLEPLKVPAMVTLWFAVTAAAVAVKVALVDP